MATLTTKQRKKLSSGEYAIPETKSYPIPDHSHAVAALQRVSQFGTPEQKAEVRSAVHRKFPDIQLKTKINNS